MLDGIEAAVRSMGQTTLTLVRIVFKKRDVQKEFMYNVNVPFFQAKSNGGEQTQRSMKMLPYLGNKRILRCSDRCA